MLAYTTKGRCGMLMDRKAREPSAKFDFRRTSFGHVVDELSDNYCWTMMVRRKMGRVAATCAAVLLLFAVALITQCWKVGWGDVSSLESETDSSQSVARLQAAAINQSKDDKSELNEISGEERPEDSEPHQAIVSFDQAAITDPGEIVKEEEAQAVDETQESFSPYAQGLPQESEEPSGANLPWRHVCIIGNAQREDDAIRSHNMWDSQFPSFWYVWGDTDIAKSGDLPANIFVIRTPDKKSWAQGLAYLSNLARRNFDCEYIFTHDDDLEFKNKNNDDTQSLSVSLSSLLLLYQPAVAAFPWSVGDATIPAMTELANQYNGERVAPLTGFDSGMILYHKSIVDFFVPYSPRGEGGFHGNWSLCAHFINLFAPLTFREHAIRINSIVYKNLINIDNVPRKERKKVKIDESGLAIHAESRHPYEYRFNNAFRQFLSNGLRNKYQRWGREMTTYDVTWSIEPVTDSEETEIPEIRPANHRTFNRWMVLDRLAEIYDLTHPVLSKNVWLKSKFSEVELSTYMNNRRLLGGDFRIIIHVFTMNRLYSLNRLWLSINKANQINRAISILIHLDFDNSSEREQHIKYLKHLRSLSSKHGPVSLQVNLRRKGLRNNILDAWSPIDNNEYAIFLEDDVSVSPHFLEYAEQMIQVYLSPRRGGAVSSSCIGVSLYNQRYDEVNDREWEPPVSENNEPYILQMPQSWGAVYSADGWSDFLKWYTTLPTDFNPLVPNSMTNRWPAEKSWKKFLIRYMLMKGKYLIYPNLPGGLSLSTNNLEPGTNDRLKGKALEEMRQRFKVPLLDLKSIATHGANHVGQSFYKQISVFEGTRVKLNLIPDTDFFDVDRENSSVQPSYEAYMDRLSSFEYQDETIKALGSDALHPKSLFLPPAWKLKKVNYKFSTVSETKELLWGEKSGAFDKCTLMIQVYDRTKTILERLKFYHTFHLLDSIVVVWNNLNATPPVISTAPWSKKSGSKREPSKNQFYIPIHFLRQKKNSINNRYIPFPEIKTDCIISMDDDWDMPHDHLAYAIQLFQGDFFNHLIGFQHQGRVHLPGETGGDETKAWKYSTENSKQVSIVLPSGAVFHRKYLDMYTNHIPAHAREKVDELMNCEDILFNMMIANATQSGPVVVGLFAKGLQMGGLWKNPSHFDKRSACMSYFVEHVFGGKMPLRYTRTLYKGVWPSQVSAAGVVHLS
ncbi:glycosyl transferase family 64 domain-containing protein [Zopfochytrium polystomum]|nr:glycosyl transferase family 64 domain-containing protein [Zopfochytrium polystomum]